MPFWNKEESTADNTPAQGQPSIGSAGAASKEAAASAAGGSPPAHPARAALGGTGIDATMLEAKVVEVIRTCYDPEIPVNVYELGLIYEVNVKPSGDVYVKMTLTSPMCPVAGTLPPEIEAKVASVTGVRSAQVDVVWDPPWSPEKMSEAAKLQLGML